MSKFVVMATWDDVPHLTDAVKKELWDSILAQSRRVAEIKINLEP